LGNNAQGEQFLRGLAAASGSCGSYRNSSTLGSGSALSAFAKRVVAGSAPSQPHEAAGAKPRVPLGNACEGVTLRGVEFATNKADLIGDSSAILSAATEQLRNCPGVALRVEGHTDSRGNAEYNQRLSERRATRVRRYLEAEGISAARLSSVGVSETTPVATNDTADGRQRNRRVDLVPN
jgi:outer membrane protein OmpA-like peptidoglycan-associated protein